MLFTNLVQANLKTRLLGQQIEYYTRLESTNSEAWEIINNGAQSGAVVVTDNQFQGKGCADRQWFATPDKSLTFSFLLFTELDSNLSGWLPILSGVAVHQTLKHFNIDVKLKWPNDLILDGKKVGGILCESKVKKNLIHEVVIGVGLNVNETRDDFDESLQSTATSMHIQSGKFYQRERVLAGILNCIEPIIENLPHNTKSIQTEWEKACGHLNQSVQFHHSEGIVEGIFISLGKSGSAILDVDGEEKASYFGQID